MVPPCTLPAKFAVSGVIRTVIVSWCAGRSIVRSPSRSTTPIVPTLRRNPQAGDDPRQISIATLAVSGVIATNHRVRIVALSKQRGDAGEGHMFTEVTRMWDAIVALLFDHDAFDAVFTHARNVLTGAAVVAAGLYAVHHVGDGNLHGMWNVQ